MGVALLSPSSTGKMQPFDAGIIAAVMRRYKRRLFLRVFEKLEARVQCIYDVDVLMAICWKDTEW